VLFNNAGVVVTGHSFEGLDNWKTVMDVNVIGCVPSPVFALSLSLSLIRPSHSVLNVQHTFVPVWSHITLFVMSEILGTRLC
jgi:hypothetical protein